MTTYIPLDKNKHANCGWKRYSHYGHASDKAIAPMGLAELAEAVGEFPLAFARLAGGQFRFVAMLGLVENSNLFIQNGQWTSRYIPAYFRAYPFALLPLEKAGEGAEDKLALCVDEQSELFLSSARGGQPFLTSRAICTRQLSPSRSL